MNIKHSVSHITVKKCFMSLYNRAGCLQEIDLLGVNMVDIIGVVSCVISFIHSSQ